MLEAEKFHTILSHTQFNDCVSRKWI
ncbi:hypothetical protein PSEUDO9AZ_30034 [Pseudomonas sp. 9AZ]|nr:hypothetical protein PSEUDO9AZ_30034 [Pseudomonas sp. 9AZ]